MTVYWDFKIRIESKKLFYTKDMREVLKQLFDSSEAIHSYEIIME